MKKILLILAMSCSMWGYSQIVDVSTVRAISIPQSENSGYATISPDGSYLLVSDFGYKGLKKLDLSTNTLSVITDAAGAGYDVKVSDDGNTIVYREKTINSKKLRMSALKSVNLSSGKTETLVESTHDLQGVAIKGDNVYAVKSGKLSVKTMKTGVKADKSTPVVSIDNGQLMLTVNGKKKTFSPNGTSVRYIWPSVSPSGEKVLYYVSGVGAYVCNIDGSNVKSLGTLRAAKWYNDDTIIGMNDADNGTVTTSSSIVMKTLDGTEQTLTDSSVIAMYPSSTLQGDKILFITPEGKSYIIDINVKK